MSVRQGSSVIAGGIQIDNTPTSGSSNAVSSGGTYTALTGKADTDLSNLTATGKAVCANLVMPGNNFINLTVGVSGANYRAPADGYFVCYSSNICNTIIRNASYYIGSTVVGASGYVNFNTFPVKKDDLVSFSYSAAIDKWLFCYANGELP